MSIGFIEECLKHVSEKSVLFKEIIKPLFVLS